MTAQDVEKMRSFKVTKANALIQQTRFHMPYHEYRLLNFLMSKIQPNDTDFHVINVSVQDFCRVVGIDETNGGNYVYLKKITKSFMSRIFEIYPDSQTTIQLMWVSSCVYQHKKGTIEFTFNERLKPYLLALQERFTTYSLYYTLAMKSQYSVRIYELLKSWQGKGCCEYDIDELKRKLMCENYTRYPDFERKVLAVAKKEICKCSDLLIDYEPVKDGRRYAKIAFTIGRKKGLEQSLEIMKNIETAMKNKPRKKADGDSTFPEPEPPLDGQTSLFGGGDNN
jgi:plasmid replication initiation protein